MKEVFGFDFKTIDDLYIAVEKELKFSEFQEFDDREVIEYLYKLHPLCGELYIINDYCYDSANGPFCINEEQLDYFIESYKSQYGEAFYSTDIVIVNFREKRIWVFFHEGMCWTSKVKE